MKKLNECIILFGGSSEERFVSVASAQNLSGNIPEAELWFWHKDGAVFKVSGEELKSHQNAFTTEFKPQNAANFPTLKDGFKDIKNKFLILGLHGTEGEDGTLQKVLEDNGITFSGSGSVASGLAFDKFLTKELAKKFNIPAADDFIIKDYTDHNVGLLDAFYNEHKKIVLKPLANGSSVGLYIINSNDDYQNAKSKIQKTGIGYIAEPFLEGREITVGVWEKTKGEIVSLPCSEIRVIEGRQFDYEGKYLGKGVEELTPAPLSVEDTKKCQDIALKLHQLVGCRGYSRTDMILTDKGPFLLEINTLPGLSKASFVPQQLAAMGTDLRTFFEKQLAL